MSLAWPVISHGCKTSSQMEIAASGYMVTSGNATVNTKHTRIIGNDSNMFRYCLIKELVFIILTDLAT
jgi:L-lactate permease